MVGVHASKRRSRTIVTGMHTSISVSTSATSENEHASNGARKTVNALANLENDRDRKCTRAKGVSFLTTSEKDRVRKWMGSKASEKDHARNMCDQKASMLWYRPRTMMVGMDAIKRRLRTIKIGNGCEKKATAPWLRLRMIMTGMEASKSINILVTFENEHARNGGEKKAPAPCRRPMWILRGVDDRKCQRKIMAGLDAA